MALKSLDEHEREARERHEQVESGRRMVPNGIACPKCGEELRDFNRDIVLASNPPKYNTICPACGHRGYRTI